MVFSIAVVNFGAVPWIVFAVTAVNAALAELVTVNNAVNEVNDVIDNKERNNDGRLNNEVQFR